MNETLRVAIACSLTLTLSILCPYFWLLTSKVNPFLGIAVFYFMVLLSSFLVAALLEFGKGVKVEGVRGKKVEKLEGLKVEELFKVEKR